MGRPTMLSVAWHEHPDRYTCAVYGNGCKVAPVVAYVVTKSWAGGVCEPCSRRMGVLERLPADRAELHMMLEALDRPVLEYRQ
jgi:hypothetical protein